MSPLFPDENMDQQKMREKVLKFYEQQERIKKACDKGSFKIYRVTDQREDSFLLSIRMALEKDNYRYYSTRIDWLRALQKNAEHCGISSSKFINVDNLNGDFLKVIEKELGQYKLKIKRCNDDKNRPELEDLKTVNDKGSKEIDIISLGELGYAVLIPAPDILKDPEEIINEVCEKEGFTRGNYLQEEDIEKSFFRSMKLAIDDLNRKKHNDLEKWEKSVELEKIGFFSKNRGSVILAQWAYYSTNEMKIAKAEFGNVANREAKMIHLIKISKGEKYRWVPLYPNRNQQEKIRKKVLKFIDQQEETKAYRKEMFILKTPGGGIEERFISSLHFAIIRRTNNIMPLNDWITKMRDAAERSGISRFKIIGMDDLKGDFLKEIENALGECKLTIKRCNDRRPELEDLQIVNDRGSKEIYLLNTVEGDFLVLLPDLKKRPYKENENPKEDAPKTQESNQKTNEMIGEVCQKEGFTQGGFLEADLERSFFLSMKLASDDLDGKEHHDLKKWEKSVKFEENSDLSHGRGSLIIAQWAYYSTNEMKIRKVESGKNPDLESPIIHIMKVSIDGKYCWIPIFPNRDRVQQK